MDKRVQRRVATLAGQVESATSSAAVGPELQHTSSQAGLASQSVVLPERLSDPGPWRVRRAANCPDHLTTSFSAPGDHVKTLYDNFEHALSSHPEIPCLGQRPIDGHGKAGPYHWMSYAEVAETRTAIGSGLLHLGLQPGSNVGLYSINCREWVLADFALHAYSMVSVPLYDTLGADAVRYILSHAELQAIACSLAVLPTLLQCLPECPNVKIVAVYGAKKGQYLPGIPQGTRSTCRILRLDDVISLGKEHPRAHIPPSPKDLALICFTSGTTGVPKGAMLTHGNLIANAGGDMDRVDKDSFKPGCRYLSYLPLAHIYERILIIKITHLAGSIAFYRGDVLLLLEDIETVKPHIFASVPRLYNRIYDRVMGTIRDSNPISRALFNAGYASKRAAILAGDPSGGRMAPFWDRLVFSKVKARLGGEVMLLVSGASPISEEVMLFLRICFSAPVVEGYGMTENACTMTITGDQTTALGNVGWPSQGTEVKLEDIPDMGYTHADKPYPRGEICVRGPTVFKGYWKDEKNTRETIDRDGWLHTGDVGCWVEGGCLKIIDRKKNLFKLAQGEYIAPEKIENVYTRSPLVAQVFVYGDSLRSQLVAVAVPDPEASGPWAQSRDLPTDMVALCKESQFKDAVFKSLIEEGRAAKLQGFEQVADVHLHPELFSTENDLMTPTFKIKRPQAKKTFQEALNAMYAKLPNST